MLPPLLVGTEAMDDGGAAEWSGGGGTPSRFLPEPPATTASTSPFTACASGFSLLLPLAGSTAHLLPRPPDLVPGRRPPGGRRSGGGPRGKKETTTRRTPTGQIWVLRPPRWRRSTPLLFSVAAGSVAADGTPPAVICSASHDCVRTMEDGGLLPWPLRRAELSFLPLLSLATSVGWL